ncbi:MAG: hypothetical protein KC586_21235 [Myxococcales bacterium]|nr:hypothetical protein [Myxococcales bacterium]
MRRVLLLVLAACGGSNAPSDAGLRDAGADGGARDAGVPVDADVAEDAGAFDAGDDTGTDAGVDAGVACEAPYPTNVDAPDAPPFSGTAFVTNDLLRPSDPSSFVSLAYAGVGTRTMFDRRTASFGSVEAHLFDATFGVDTQVEIQVNPEFDRATAETHARRYAEVIGRLPAFLFADLRTVWIHDGMELFGGGNQNLLIHTQQGDAYGDSLEEIFVHEGAHTSLDGVHAASARWLEAQAADVSFISTYARDNPTREDVAESLGPYLAYRFGGDRVSAELRAQIQAAMPNRIRYFDCLGLSMDPLPTSR